MKSPNFSISKPQQYRHYVQQAIESAIAGVDELVFYDITASSDGRTIAKEWVRSVARVIDIPFCVAGGIRTIEDARTILNDGADKISINSPALDNPELITAIADAFGVQSIVVGIDSRYENGEYKVYKYTGDVNKTMSAKYKTYDWITEVQKRGAGEIVLNCMNADGVRNGYDIEQLYMMREITNIPLIASGGAGSMQHFADVFTHAHVDGALAASVFHKDLINIPDLKQFLRQQHIHVR